MKISDYIVNYLKTLGIKYVFGVQGSGTVVQLFDSLSRASGIDYVCNNHEQASGMAADAYADITGNFGVCMATSGPGASNLYTSVAGSFYNSVPVLYIVGQPQTYVLRKNNKIRHYGFHENDIYKMFRHITKYVVQVNDPKRVCYELEKSIYYLKNGRPGPTVIALPDDITWQQIEPESLKHYKPKKTVLHIEEVESIIKPMKLAKRPLIIVGKGVKCSGATDAFLKLNNILNWPVALTWGAKDLLTDDDEFNVGCFGNLGSRSGNFAVQNADFIISIGARLDPFEIGPKPELFSRESFFVSVDIDRFELDKYSEYGIKCNVPICADAKNFISQLNDCIRDVDFKRLDGWLTQINNWKKMYSFPKCDNSHIHLDPYSFTDCLSKITKENDIIVTDASTSRSYVFQSFRTKNKQRIHTWGNYCCLGYGLPAAIGASFASNKRVFAIMGDGALQFNIQELATIIYNKLNIKIIIFDNKGYSNIEHAQDGHLDSRYCGADIENGLPLPNSSEIAKAYGFPVVDIFTNYEMVEKLEKVVASDGPYFCALHLSIHESVTPARKGNDPLEDMTPKLEWDELCRQMIVDPIKR